MSVKIGTFIAVVGRSGVGKDSILEGAQSRLDNLLFYFPRRFITRPADAGGENHMALTLEEFKFRQTENQFALHWKAHGLYYALDEEITGMVGNGLHVIANISRTIIADARLKFENLRVIEIISSPETIADRLSLRDRESQAQQQARRQRRVETDWSGGLAITRITNDGLLSDAIDAFVATVVADIADKE